MIPHYVTDDYECERCGSDIYLGYEAILHEDGMFCDEDCFKEHLYEGSGAKEVYLTDDRIWRAID